MTFFDNPAAFDSPGAFDTPGLIAVTVLGIYPRWKVWSAPMMISSLSTEYVPVNVTCSEGGVVYNPTGDLVYMAFTAGNAAPATWYPASWGTTVTPGVYQALCLVGPANGGVVLGAGVYTVWLKVTDTPEVPARPAGTLTVY